MRKILLTVLTITMMLSMSMAFAQEAAVVNTRVTTERPMRNVIFTQGEIQEISEGQIRVLGEGNYKDVVLHIQDNTYILNAHDGTPILFEDLKQGDVVTAYYGPALTRSLPPQGRAIALIVGTPEEGSAGMYMKVGKLQENKNGGIRVLCTNNERLVAILPETFAQVADIKEGTELIVWYDVMTMSIPAQATATKVVLLPNRLDIKQNVDCPY